VLAVLDGDPTSTRGLTEFLAERGFHLWTVHSGAAALTVLRSEALDGVIIDFRLPDVRGDVLLSASLAIQPRLTGRVVLTTPDDADAAITALQDFQCPILHKPVAFESLARLMSAAVSDPRMSAP
jgi:DNA-binding NtrC family response regulator